MASTRSNWKFDTDKGNEKKINGPIMRNDSEKMR